MSNEVLTPSSVYVPMADDVRLAVSVWAPTGPGPFPAVIVATEYWRCPADPALRGPHDTRAAAFNDRGYAVVAFDIRGSGASFGSRTGVFTPQIRDDLHAMVRWTVSQPWSDGTVFADGVSNPGTMGEFLVATGDPAVTGVSMRFADIDLYADTFYPGGVATAGLTKLWQETMLVLDGLADPGDDLTATQRELLARLADGPLPVEADADRSLLRAAIDDHRHSMDVHHEARDVVFRDDPFGPDGYTLDDVSAMTLGGVRSTAHVPMLVVASWSDAATARGALRRFANSSRPMTVIIGPWSHGALNPGDPFEHPAGEPPAAEEQFASVIDFFDACRARRVSERRVRYYVLGSGDWVETDSWPPTETHHAAWRLAAPGRLEPTGNDGVVERHVDHYDVDFDASTGAASRWLTQRGGGTVDYGDRATADGALLTYDSAPLESPLTVLGTPRAVLELSVSADDAAVFVYLEDIAPDGRVRMISEGSLRLVHRHVRNDVDPELANSHSFRRSDARPDGPRAEAVTVDLLPVAYVARAGHRLRLAIAGADADSFERIPATGDVRFEVAVGGDAGSTLELPISRSI